MEDKLRKREGLVFEYNKPWERYHSKPACAADRQKRQAQRAFEVMVKLFGQEDAELLRDALVEGRAPSYWRGPTQLPVQEMRNVRDYRRMMGALQLALEDDAQFQEIISRRDA